MPTLLCSRRHLCKKLFTREDPVYLHKTLGLLSLVSFAYRYLYVYPRRGDLGFLGDNWVDHLTLLLHFALSCSSIIFHVLQVRRALRRMAFSGSSLPVSPPVSSFSPRSPRCGYPARSEPSEREKRNLRRVIVLV